MKTNPLRLAAPLAVVAVVAALSIVFLAAAPAPSAPATPTGIVVKIDNFSFSPPSLEVAVGATVTWVNHDDIPHTVVSTDKVFKSKVLDTDETFSYTFAKAGKYPYFCSLHPKMTGEVVVH
jgi:plastocyanin